MAALVSEGAEQFSQWACERLRIVDHNKRGNGRRPIGCLLGRIEFAECTPG